MITHSEENPVVLVSAEMGNVEMGRLAGRPCAYYSARAPDKSTPNEDSLAILPTGDSAGVLVIADGCGGEANGLEASKCAIEVLSGMLREGTPPRGLRGAILDGFEAAHLSVLDLPGGAATTLLAVEIHDAAMRTYHAGDSKALLLSQHGTMKLQTLDHSPVSYAVEAGGLTEDEALLHEYRHLVSNVIGASPLHIDVGMPVPLAKRDTLVLGTDGLFDNLTLAEISVLARKGTLQHAAEALRAAVTTRMAVDEPGLPSKPDDCSFILYRA